MYAALSSPSGTMVGKLHRFPCGLELNPLSMLYCLKVIAKYGSLCNRSSKAVRPQDLRGAINTFCTFHQLGVDGTYGSYLLKSIFAILTSGRELYFPGNIVNSLKEQIKVSSTEALLHKLGYSPSCVSTDKVKYVVSLNERKRTPEGGPEKMVLCTFLESKDDTISHKDFSIAIKMAMPLIDPSSSEPLKDQISAGSFKPKSKESLVFFKENRDVVTALNLSYAIGKAAMLKKGKATPSHFVNAKGKLISALKRMAISDSTGKRYGSFNEIPDHIKRFLLSTFGRKTQQSRQAAEFDTLCSQIEATTKDISKNTGDIQTNLISKRMEMGKRLRSLCKDAKIIYPFTVRYKRIKLNPSPMADECS